MFVVDTNILVYAVNEDSLFHTPCAAALASWRRGEGAWYTTWNVLYEFLRVVTHRRVMRSPWAAEQAWAFVEALLASPGFDVLVATERHAAIAAKVIQEVPEIAGNLVHDAHTAILMREHGIRRVYTRDVDFHRFPFLEVVDPTRTDPSAAERPAKYGTRRRRSPSAARQG